MMVGCIVDVEFFILSLGAFLRAACVEVVERLSFNRILVHRDRENFQELATQP